MDIFTRYYEEDMRNFLVLARCRELDMKKVRFCSGNHIGRLCKDKHIGKVVLPSIDRANIPTIIKFNENQWIQVTMMKCTCQHPKFSEEELRALKRSHRDL